MTYLRWLLPNAPMNQEAMTSAWYVPKALPNAVKPRVPGEADEASAPDDEEGIMTTVDKMDKLVQDEIDRGVDPSRIIIGGFSQGCAVSLVWGQVGRLRNKVGGVVCIAGYFPLADRIEALRKERNIPVDEKGEKKWFYVHGSKDMLVPLKLFAQGTEELCKRINKDDLDGHVYDGMGHSTDNRVLRDLLGFLSKVIPP